MCLSPNYIKNPNYRADIDKNFYNRFKDCSSQYIKVPCGVCSECIARKQMDLVQRIQVESKYNHVFYTTLTYNNDMLPRLDVNGYSIPYADVSDVQKMIKYLRKYNSFTRPFRYFAVSELGSKRGRPHFHICWLLPKYEGDDFNTCINLEKIIYKNVLAHWQRNLGSTRNPDFHPLCTYVEKYSGGMIKRNYDTHYVNPALSDNGVSDVGFYILKYMLKPSTRARRLQQALRLNLPDDEYEKVWSLVRPRYFKSLDFGLSKNPDVVVSLRDGIDKFKDSFPYPVFVKDDGHTFPLARFYRSKGDIYDIDTATYFYMNQPSERLDTVVDDMDKKSLTECLNSINRLKKSVRLVDMSDDDILFN